MMIQIKTRTLTTLRFEPFGDVLDCSGPPDKIINAGYCKRYHNRARLNFNNGEAGISFFQAKPRCLPYQFNMLERHPEGSQAFIPLSPNPFLVIVAQNKNNHPTNPIAFLTKPNQGVNIHRGIWHGVLTPLTKPGIFAVIDQISQGENLEERWLDFCYEVVLP
jgi:ureidoglycolate lyase